MAAAKKHEPPEQPTLATAAEKLDAARKKLAGARTHSAERAAHKDACRERAMDQRTASAQKAYGDARDEHDIAIGLESRAEDDLKQASDAYKDVRRKTLTERYVHLRDEQVAHSAKLPEVFAKYVAFDRQIEEFHDINVREEERMADSFTELAALAEELGLMDDLKKYCVRPTLEQMCEEIVRAVTLARLDERRVPVAPVVLAHNQSLTHWSTKGMTAAERAASDGWRANQQQITSDLQFGAAIDAARLAGANESARFAKIESSSAEEGKTLYMETE